MIQRPISLGFGIAVTFALLGVGGMVMAQGQQVTQGGRVVDQGTSAGDFSGSYEISGVEIDVKGADAEAARQGGWRLAQRKGWEMLTRKLGKKTSNLSDSALDALVTGIVVEKEQIGPTRYIARLGVLFDRARAGALLGVSLTVLRSPPMLLVPLEWTGGAGVVYEHDTAWKRAWDNFRNGETSVDYIRLRGTGPDPLMINSGQVGRRGRGWWRTVLHQYGASDVLVAEVQLRREFPGGPVTGIFAASHGPDKLPIARFALRVESGNAIDALMSEGVKRIDKAFQDALAQGKLKSDQLLAYRPPVAAATEEEEGDEEGDGNNTAAPTVTPAPSAPTVATFTVQVDTPSASALTGSESAIRGVPGVRSATTTSLALGGISVMRVSYDGSIDSLRSALEARGWSVQQGAGVLRIRRPGQSTDDAN